MMKPIPPGIASTRLQHMCKSLQVTIADIPANNNFLELRGRAAHQGNRQLGKQANTTMIVNIQRFEREEGPFCLQSLHQAGQAFIRTQSDSLNSLATALDDGIAKGWDGCLKAPPRMRVDSYFSELRLPF